MRGVVGTSETAPKISASYYSHPCFTHAREKKTAKKDKMPLLSLLQIDSGFCLGHPLLSFLGAVSLLRVLALGEAS